MQRQVARDLASLTPGEDRIEVLIVTDRSMRIMTIPRELPEATVVVIDERWHQRVCSINRRDPLEPQLLDESILQRQMRPLDAPLGRRGVRTDPIDVEFVQGAPELRMAVAAGRRLEVAPEDTGLVTVERQRLPVSLQILSRGLKVRSTTP